MTLRKFRFTDIEFAIIAFLLLGCLTVLMGHVSPEGFAEEEDDSFFKDGTRKILTLLELPGYIQNGIGGQIKGIVDDMKKANKNSSNDVMSKETLTDDPDVAKDGKVDEEKFNALKREYQGIEAMLKAAEEVNPSAHTRIFGEATVQ